MFSSDGHRLFITQSNKQINIYHQGANLFVIFQTLYVNLHMKNLFALARNAKYLSTIQRNDSAIYLSLHEFSR